MQLSTIRNFCIPFLFVSFLLLGNLERAKAQVTPTTISATTSALALALPRPRYLVIPRYGDGKVSIIDGVSGTEAARLSTGPKPNLVAMSHDNRFAYILHGAHGSQVVQTQLKILVRLSKIDFRSLSVVNTNVLQLSAFSYSQFNSGIRDLEISPDSSTLAILGAQQGWVHRVDTSTLQLTHEIQICTVCNGSTQPLMANGQLSFSNNGQRIGVALNYHGSYVTLNAADLTVINSPALTNLPNNIVSTRDKIRLPGFGQYALMPYTNTNIQFVNEMTGQIGELPNTIISGASGGDELVLIKTPRLFLLAQGNYSLGSLDTDTIKFFDFYSFSTFELPVSEAPTKVLYNEKRNELWAFCFNSNQFSPFCRPYEVDVYSTITGQRTSFTGSFNGAPNGVEHSHDGQKIFFRGPPVAGQETLMVVDAVNKQEIGTIPMGGPVGSINMQGIFRQGDCASRRAVF